MANAWVQYAAKVGFLSITPVEMLLKGINYSYAVGRRTFILVTGHSQVWPRRNQSNYRFGVNALFEDVGHIIVNAMRAIRF
jgi:hypothetical protein